MDTYYMINHVYGDKCGATLFILNWFIDWLITYIVF